MTNHNQCKYKIIKNFSEIVFCTNNKVQALAEHHKFQTIDNKNHYMLEVDSTLSETGRVIN